MRTINKTYSMKKSEIDKKWYVIDATGIVVGRLAAEVSKLLRGKHKPTYTPSMDCGDYVIITNADKAVFTGKKEKDKTYYWHTGYIGGLKSATPKSMRLRGFPERIVHKAISRMLSSGPMSRQHMRNCKIYCSDQEHPHGGQTPEPIDLRVRNKKNFRN